MLRIVQLRRNDGAALTEFALLLPIFLALLFWSNLLWDISKKRIRTNEVARYAAWELVGYQGSRGASAIRSETLTRFADLDGSTPTGTRPGNVVDFNQVTVEATVQTLDSVNDSESGSSGGAFGPVKSAVGSTLRPVFKSLVGNARLNTRASAAVTFKVKNRVVPTAFKAGTNLKDPMEFKSKAVVLFDTWDAWRPGDAPSNSLNVVRSRIKKALKDSEGVVTFPGLGLVLGGGTAVGGALSAVLSVLQLPYPFDIKDHHVQMGNRTLANELTAGYVSSTSAGVPGALAEGNHWRGNGVGPPGGSSTANYSGVLKDSRSYYRAATNRHSRARACRGGFYDGSRTQQAEYYSYRIANDACVQDGLPFVSDAPGTRRGLTNTSFPQTRIEASE